MAKDKIIGFLIFILGLLVVLYYTWNVIIVAAFGHFWPSFLWFLPHVEEWAVVPLASPPPSWYWFLAIPIWLALTLVLVIGMWIGWTMFTTPPPVPFEELEKEEEGKQKKEKKPAKKVAKK
ncbi:MAG: hypothetical protein WED04_12800 [Promethearchaeati archaeon SRVP18_Atabeyarchaeia-1]